MITDYVILKITNIIMQQTGLRSVKMEGVKNY